MRALRWNATAVVPCASRKPAEPGGHIASYQSSARLYEEGYNHFWKGPDHPNGKRIGAENAGVAVDERGFVQVVDSEIRTHQPHICAIRDIIRQPMAGSYPGCP